MKPIIIAAIALCSVATAQDDTKPLSPKAKAELARIQKSILIPKAIPLVEKNEKHNAEMAAWVKMDKARKIAEEKESREYNARADALIEHYKALSAKIPARSYIPKSDTDWIIDAIERNGCRH